MAAEAAGAMEAEAETCTDCFGWDASDDTGFIDTEGLGVLWDAGETDTKLLDDEATDTVAELCAVVKAMAKAMEKQKSAVFIFLSSLINVL